MRAIDLIIDFINFTFLLTLISLGIIFFITGDNFNIFMRMIQGLSFILLFGLLFFIKSKLNQREFKKRSKENNLEITLRLSFTDKIVFDIILFLIPIIILLIPYLTGAPTLTDLFQALIAFLTLYFLENYLFGKTY